MVQFQGDSNGCEHSNGFLQKKASDDIIVKFMHCEKEVAVPIETDITPFYHWKDVEIYYRNLLKKLP